MAQHDYVIDNASGATVRADINSALSAIQTLNSGTSEPSSTAAGMLWLDTTGGAPYALKVRDAGNNHWLTLASVTDPGADGNLSVAAIEGTAVLSTGESGGSKFLREDGDGSCSWQSAGKILQVKSTTKTDAFSTNSTTATDVTGLSVDITPESTSNKILVTISLNYGGSTNLYGKGYVLRDSTIITTSTAVSLSNQVNASFGVGTSGSDGQYKMASLVFNYLDSPSSTSLLTYKLQVGSHNSAAYFYVNRTANNSNDSYVMGGVSSITVMEIEG